MIYRSHLISFALLLLSLQVQAQQLNLDGKVLDTSKAVVPNAQINLTSGSGLKTTRSDDSGVFRFQGLTPGTYHIRAEATGYRKYEKDLKLDLSRTVDVHLEVSGITDTVTVSAERIEQDEQSVPTSVTALGAKAVRDSRIQEFSTISNYVSNLHYADYAGRGVYGFLTIRGLGNSNASIEPGATVFVDGVPFTDFQSYSQQLYDIDHIEVLRGPQSTLYGGFAEAGVVNIFTRAPEDRFRLFGRQEYGNFNSYLTTLSGSGPLVHKHLYLGLAGSVSGSDGHFKNSFTGKRFGEFLDNGRATIRYTPIERLDIQATVSGQKINDDGGQLVFPVDNAAYNQLVAPVHNGPFEAAYDYAGKRQTGTNMESIVARYTADRFQIISTTARRENGINYSWDYDETPAPYFVASVKNRPREFYQEARIQSADTTFNYVAGFSYNRHRQRENGSLLDEQGLFGGPARSVYSVYNTSFSADTYGGYGQVAKRVLAKRLGLTAGVRIDHADRSVNQAAADLLGPGFRLGREESRAVPKFAVDYRIADGLMAYGTVASGWKPGGINPLADSSADAVYKAEHSWNYEGGFKSSLLNQKLTVDLTGFYNRISDYQDSVVRSSLVFLIGNAELATVGGTEVEVSWRPISGLEVQGAYGLARARYGTYILNPQTGFNYNGQRIPQIPDSNSNIVVQYTSPMHLFARGELINATNFTTYSYTPQSATSPEVFMHAVVPGYTVGNLRGGYESPRFTMTGYISNIANTRYFQQASTTPAFGSTGFFGSLALPRTYGLRAEIHFH